MFGLALKVEYQLFCMIVMPISGLPLTEIYRQKGAQNILLGQCLSIIVSLLEGLRSIPSTHTIAYKHV